MKKLVCIINGILFGLCGFSQTTIRLVIKDVANHKIDKVDAFDLSQMEIFEQPYSDTLSFTFKKSGIDCYNIRYHENEKMYRQQIWLDAGDIKIEAHLDSTELVIDTVFNSPQYYAFLNFKKDYATLYKSKDSISLNTFLLETYKKNIDNPFSLLAGNLYVKRNQNLKSNLYKLKEWSDKQGDKFEWFFLYPLVAERLKSILTVSSINLKDYEFTNRKNKHVKFDATAKDYYILDFWFQGCAPCESDHKIILKQLKKIEEKNASFISISIHTKFESWNKYLTKNGYNWQNYFESETNSITEKLNIHSFPTYFVIDKNGIILNTQNSITDVIAWLAKR